MDTTCLNCENIFESKRDSAKFCSGLCRATFSQNLNRNNGNVIITIYALCNPLDKDNVFYIGKTIGSLNQRLTTHLKDGINIGKNGILKDIINNGYSPTIIELQKINYSDDNEEIKALEQEQYWIDHYINKGMVLTNIQGVKTKLKYRLLANYQKNKTKSGPTGIRFDLEKVDYIKKRENLTTNQQVVNFLTEKYWWELKIALIKNEIEHSEIVVPDKTKKPIPEQKVNKNPIDTPPMPVKIDGENSFDYAARKNEWKHKYGI